LNRQTGLLSVLGLIVALHINSGVSNLLAKWQTFVCATRAGATRCRLYAHERALCECSTIGVSQTLIQAKKRAVDVGATWKVAAESNVLMTEEEAKARLVLEIAYQEMEETKNSPAPGSFMRSQFSRRRSCCPVVAVMESCKSSLLDYESLPFCHAVSRGRELHDRHSEG
jgi:hypothetical protein